MMIGVLLSACVLITTTEAGLRDEEQFQAPMDLNQFALGDLMQRSPSWALPPNLLLNMDSYFNKIMEVVQSTYGSGFGMMNQADVNWNLDDCIMTVKLGRNQSFNNTDVKIYTANGQVELHICTTRLNKWTNSGNDTAIEGTGGLRGYGEMMSSTRVQRFAAPSHCDVSTDTGKATVDNESLLIKFPRKPSPANNKPSDSPSNNPVSNPSTNPGEIPPDSPHSASPSGIPTEVTEPVEDPVTHLVLELTGNSAITLDAKSWWGNPLHLFKSKPNLSKSQDVRTVPLVEKEEF